MPPFDEKFSNLNDLFTIFNDRDIIIGRGGVYDEKQPNPGPHVMLTSKLTTTIYDFVKKDDNTYTLLIRK